MGTIADKLNRLINTKEGIRQEINRAYGSEEISILDTFKSYIQKLEEHPYYLNGILDGSIKNIKNSNVTSIGDGAFYDCSNLTDASFPNVTNIGGSAFNGCSNLTNISFPNVTSIGDGVFSDCSSLTNVSFPNVTNIGGSAFNGCQKLTDVSFPNVTSIGDELFGGCSSLTNVSFPKATSIGNDAFVNCSSLTSVFFPNVTRIGNGAFNGCQKLITIYMGIESGQVCSLLNTDAFTNCNNLTNIYVPYSLVDSYKSATNWSNYADKIKSYEQLVECITLSITADDVAGNITSTTVYYTAECTYTIEGVLQEGTKVFTGKVKSESFAQNTSTTNTVQRTISFTLLGKTATTTITQGVWVNPSISVTTSGISDYGWVAADSHFTVDGYDVYRANTGSNKGIAVMKLECTGYLDLTIYIRSYVMASPTFEYTIASNANVSTYPTSYDSSDTKAHTKGNSNSNTALSSYTAVNYTGLSGHNDTIYIVYLNEASPCGMGYFGGFVLIPKQS